MESPFLTASWRQLIMANYAVEEASLYPYLPKGIELDTFEGQHFVSLVGFIFGDVKLKGLSIPFHNRFAEVNLRLYVKRETAAGWRRGVVFIREIVPLPMVSVVANLLYGERYATCPVKASASISEHLKTLEYSWKAGAKWNRLSCRANTALRPMAMGSMEAFIFEHYYGYAKAKGGEACREYEVKHPSWQTHEVKDFTIDCAFEKSFGMAFQNLNHLVPVSVYLAEGSEVAIMPGRLIA